MRLPSSTRNARPRSNIVEGADVVRDVGCIRLIRAYHVLLSNPGTRYHDLGPDYYEQQRNIARQVSHHVGKLSSLGYEVTLCRRPGPDEPGATPRPPDQPEPQPTAQTAVGCCRLPAKGGVFRVSPKRSRKQCADLQRLSA